MSSRIVSKVRSFLLLFNLGEEKVSASSLSVKPKTRVTLGNIAYFNIFQRRPPSTGCKDAALFKRRCPHFPPRPCGPPAPRLVLTLQVCSARGPWKCFSSDFPLKLTSSLNRSIISLGERSVWTFRPHSAAFVAAVLPVG